MGGGKVIAADSNAKVDPEMRTKGVFMYVHELYNVLSRPSEERWLRSFKPEDFQLLGKEPQDLLRIARLLLFSFRAGHEDGHMTYYCVAELVNS